MNPLFTIKDVSLRYKRSGNIFHQSSYYHALKSISFDIYPGETLGIVGKNGSGKSTLLRLISGVIKPDSGEIISHGASVSLLALQAGFNPHLSGHDNAILAGMLQGFPKKIVKDYIAQIHDYSELGDFFYEPIRTYSTGMRARLGFSISINLRTDLLLIDEVLSVGDSQFRQKAEDTMIKKINSNQTVVLVSHSQAQISRLCNRVAIIEKGTIGFIGDPKKAIELYENT